MVVRQKRSLELRLGYGRNRVRRSRLRAHGEQRRALVKLDTAQQWSLV